jgi:type IV pilus assembly protein PilV
MFMSPGKPQRQRGTSLIESLVAMVVLSLGVLGLLGVQLRTMVNNQAANHMATAARLTDSLMERIKSNPDAARSLNAEFVPARPLDGAQWSWLENYETAWGSTATVPTTGSGNCDTDFCSAAQRATWDINRWKQAIAQSLPNGDGLVLVSPDDVRQLVVIVGWRANEQGESPLVISIPGVTAPTQCGTTHACYAAYGQP